MATIISDELKEYLMSKGIWGDFVRQRTDLQMTQGIGSMKANRIVMEEFVTKGLVPDEIVAKIRPRGRPKKAAVSAEGGERVTVSLPKVVAEAAVEVDEGLRAAAAEVVSGKVSLADARRKGRDAKAEASAKAVADAPMVSRKMFDGKRCSIYTAFMWAYENLRFVDVTPADAPSSMAWNLMLDMRSSPSMKADLLRAGIGRAMSKTDEDESSGKRFDGEGEYNLLERLAEGGAS